MHNCPDTTRDKEMKYPLKTSLHHSNFDSPTRLEMLDRTFIGISRPSRNMMKTLDSSILKKKTHTRNFELKSWRSVSHTVTGETEAYTIKDSASSYPPRPWSGKGGYYIYIYPPAYNNQVDAQEEGRLYKLQLNDTNLAPSVKYTGIPWNSVKL